MLSKIRTIKNVLADASVGEQVTLGGWVRTLRTSKGGFSFITINDGSCFATIQVVADGKLANYENEITHLTAGCSVPAKAQPPPQGFAICWRNISRQNPATPDR